MSLNQLSTTPLADEVDFNNLPEQGGGFPDPPQPGTYRFQLPASLSLAQFEEIDSKDFGKRLKVSFNDQAPLTIVQSPLDQANGEPFQTTLTNVPMERGKKGSGTYASDVDYLLHATGYTGARPNSNKAYADALIAQAHAKASFTGDLKWSWRCNPDRDAYFADGTGGSAPVVDAATGQNHKGCGEKYKQDGVAKVEGRFPVRITCTKCGAVVRAFANLQRIRA